MRLACPECYEVFEDRHDEPATTSLEYHMDKHSGGNVKEGVPTEARVKNQLVKVAKDAHDGGLADFAVDQMLEDARNQFRRERMSNE